MREILLNREYVALVDDEDYERVVAVGKWCEDDGYAVRGSKPYCMARFILGLTDPKIEVDHEDHNGLNNQKYNLRVATRVQNNHNLRKQRPPTSSKYKGVSFDKGNSKWVAQIKIAGRSKHLGYFLSEDQAARIYDEAARLHFGEFACTNFAEAA
jgi:hypothetical protein